MINFFLIAVILFIILKVFTTLNNKRKELAKKEEAQKPAVPAPAPTPSEEVLLLREIRDSLNKQNK